MRSLTSVQMALLFALFGSVVAVFVPHFVRNLQASRLNEPLDGLAHLGAWASSYAAGMPLERAYPDSAPLTPEVVPAGQARSDGENVWRHPTWRLLSFEKTEPHYFSFEFESHTSESGAHFYARAFGDLDGDGDLSRFELFGETRPGEHPRLYAVQIHREVE